MRRVFAISLLCAMAMAGSAAARDGYKSYDLGKSPASASAEALKTTLSANIDKANRAHPDHPVEVITADVDSGVLGGAADQPQALIMLSGNPALCKPEGCLVVFMRKIDEAWKLVWGVYANGRFDLAEKIGTAAPEIYAEGRNGCQLLNWDKGSARPSMAGQYPWACNAHDAAAFAANWAKLKDIADQIAKNCVSDVSETKDDVYNATISFVTKGDSQCVVESSRAAEALDGALFKSEKGIVLAYRPSSDVKLYSQEAGYAIKLPPAAE